MTKSDLMRRVFEECGSHEAHRKSGRPCRMRRSPAAGGGLVKATPCTAVQRRATLQDPQTGARVNPRRRGPGRRRSG
jgi:hypothetical protein